jgi:hypothetical protein
MLCSEGSCFVQNCEWVSVCVCVWIILARFWSKCMILDNNMYVHAATCMHAYKHMCNQMPTKTASSVLQFNSYLYRYVCMYTRCRWNTCSGWSESRIYVCACVHMYVYTNACCGDNACRDWVIYIHVCVHMCVCVCIYIYIYIYVHLHVCIYK